MFNRLDHYITHKNRKTICNATRSTEIPTDTNYISIDSNYECITCHKTFQDSANLNRHLQTKQHKNNHEMVSALKTMMLDFKKEVLAKIDEVNVNKTTNVDPSSFNLVNDNSNNINNNINFHIENLKDTKDFLSDDRKYHLLQRGRMALPYLVEDVNFNPDHPENHNMYISNNKTKVVHIKRNGQWESHKGREIISEVIYDYDYRFFRSFAEGGELEEKYKNASKYYYQYIDITEGAETQRKIEDSIMEMLYNKREMIIATRKREEAALKQRRGLV
jgi:hypothetical protein